MGARRGSGMSVGMGGWRGGCWSFLGGWIFLRAEVKRGEEVVDQERWEREHSALGCMREYRKST